MRILRHTVARVIQESWQDDSVLHTLPTLSPQVMNLAEIDAWVDEEDDVSDTPTQFYITQGRSFTAKGVWRKKKMRADRAPMYVKPHDERHLWLSPGIKRPRRSRRPHVVSLADLKR
jgi:hypothetical protein